MGSETVRDLAGSPKVESITIGDLNVQAARKLAVSLKSDKIYVQRVDATSQRSLIAAMKNHDVVAGALGPFYRFERPIAQAALAAEVDYVSICDDHDAVAAVLKLHEQARRNGRRILTGMGWTPGLTNLVARAGYEALDHVDAIRIYWAGSAGDATGLAVLLHTMHIFSGRVVSFQDGRHVEIKAGTGRERVMFPPPLGLVHTFHLGHPEPVTIPHNLPGPRDVLLKGGLAERYLNTLSRLMSAARLTATPGRKQRLGQVMKRLLPLFPIRKERAYSGIRVDVLGSDAHGRARLTYAAVDNMRRLTGIPLSIGAQLLGEGRIEATGVFGPEAAGAVSPAVFFSELADRGIDISARRLVR